MAYTLGLQSAQLKNFNISIDGIRLTEGQIVSLQIRWNINGMIVAGKLLFKDLSNIIKNAPIRGGNVLSIKAKDFDDVTFKQDFIITHTDGNRNVTGEPNTLITFIDNLSYKAGKIHQGLSWAECTELDIIDNPETIGGFFDKPKDFGEPTSMYENWVMPLNVNFNVVMHHLVKKSNRQFFQTREKYVYKHISELFSQNPKGDIFRYKTPNQHYRRRIFEQDGKFGKISNIDRYQPKAKISFFETEYKHKQFIEKDYKGTTSALASPGGAEQPGGDTIGTKYYYKPRLSIETYSDNMYQEHGKDLVNLHILVPGQFQTNVGDVVEVDLVNYESPETPDDNIHGKWLIKEIVDNIIPPDFVQRITLTRAKYAK